LVRARLPGEWLGRRHRLLAACHVFESPGCPKAVKAHAVTLLNLEAIHPRPGRSSQSFFRPALERLRASTPKSTHRPVQAPEQTATGSAVVGSDDFAHESKGTPRPEKAQTGLAESTIAQRVCSPAGRREAQLPTRAPARAQLRPEPIPFRQRE